MAPPRKQPVNFLRLVESNPEPAPLRPDDIARPAWQSTLFATEHPSLLVFVNFEHVSEADFLSFLMGARPRYVIDLRLVPRFDVGGLNRKLVFSLFAQISTQYVDLSGQLQIRHGRDARFNPALLVSYLQDSVFRAIKSPQGPIGFLVDSSQFDESYIQLLAEALPSLGSNGWDVLRVPHVITTSRSRHERQRDVIFISHANPEDNTFALWLAAHLSNAGYVVWTDVTRLVGGEEFWDTIEEAIRNFSVKVVVVLSRTAQIKKGVLDEINLAISIERSSSLERFVVPIRIDDLPFEDVRANLARKNIIDFRDNWATGLAQLLAVFKQDGVPSSNVGGASAIADWYSRNLQSQPTVVHVAEPLIANWLLVSSMPAYVLMHDLDIERSRINEIASRLGVPWFQFLRLMGTFCEASELQNAPVSITTQYRIQMAEFLSGRPSGLPGLLPREANRLMSSMLRQAWDKKAAACGLLAYQAASGAIVWYIPKGLIEGDRITFNDHLGKPRKKKLVGWSERRCVHWHFGVEAKPIMGRIPRFVMRSHVIFTSDGAMPLDSKERMHALRRSFCRSWWNDRWRDLLMAFIAWLAKDSDCIELPCGGDTKLTVAGSLLALRSPVSLDVDTPDISDLSDESGSEDDDLDIEIDELEETWGDRQDTDEVGTNVPVK